MNIADIEAEAVRVADEIERGGRVQMPTSKGFGRQTFLSMLDVEMAKRGWVSVGPGRWEPAS